MAWAAREGSVLQERRANRQEARLLSHPIFVPVPGALLSGLEGGEGGFTCWRSGGVEGDGHLGLNEKEERRKVKKEREEPWMQQELRGGCRWGPGARGPMLTNRLAGSHRRSGHPSGPSGLGSKEANSRPLPHAREGVAWREAQCQHTTPIYSGLS